MKRCSNIQCRIDLTREVASFSAVEGGGYCRPCKKERNDAAYDPDRWAQYYEEGRQAEGPTLPTGCTRSMYEDALMNQGYVCGGCERDFDERHQPQADHDHRCCPGRKMCKECFRGLLCATCNTTLGRVREDPSRLSAGLVAYLSKS